jgi:hypothetical protein
MPLRFSYCSNLVSREGCTKYVEADSALERHSAALHLGILQDQGDCAACTGFSLTAAAEAAVNVFKQQSWLSLSLSEQYISFCRWVTGLDTVPDSVPDCYRNSVKNVIA